MEPVRGGLFGMGSPYGLEVYASVVVLPRIDDFSRAVFERFSESVLDWFPGKEEKGRKKLRDALE